MRVAVGFLQSAEFSVSERESRLLCVLESPGSPVVTLPEFARHANADELPSVKSGVPLFLTFIIVSS